VVKTVTHEEVTAEELGGAVTHSTKSGVCDLDFENDVEALMMIRRLVGFIPGNNREKPPHIPRRTIPAHGPLPGHPGPGQPPTSPTTSGS